MSGSPFVKQGVRGRFPCRGSRGKNDPALTVAESQGRAPAGIDRREVKAIIASGVQTPAR